MSPSTQDIRAQVHSMLGQLRRSIRRYVFIEGTATVLVWLGVAFWLSLGLDYLLELPFVVRLLLAVSGVTLVVAGLAWWVALRLIRQYRLRALALILERRFPRLNDRLITLVDSFDDREQAPQLTLSMLKRTADELSELLPALHLREVFNRGPLWRAILLSVLLFAGLGAFAWGCDDVFRTWMHRNLLLADEYYRRDTELVPSMLAQPGDRIIPLAPDPAHPGSYLPYKHPRGADLTLLAEVPPEKKVPEQVRYTFDLANRSGGGRDFMTRLGERQFRCTLPGIHDDLRIWLKGGDYTSRQPLLVTVVDPPRLNDVGLDCLYPAYTRLNRLDEETKKPLRESVPVQGTQVSLPAGTDFLFHAGSNKPLRSVRIVADHFELNLTPGKATFRQRSLDGTKNTAELPISGPKLSDDLLRFTVPCVLDLKEQPELLDDKGQPLLPLRLPPNGTLLVTLHDDDDIVSLDPSRLIISAINDEPPVIETGLRGIGASITHQATIPLQGTVTDDYGVAEARFEYRIEPKEALEAREFRGKPELARKFAVQERFEVLPLDLKIGTKLVVSVVATDADNLTGPHRTQGERYTFTIVSNDELLALIAAREINLRHRFEQILGELQNARKDIQLHRTRHEEVIKLRKGEETGLSAEERRKRLATAEEQVNNASARVLSIVAKNANETASVEQSFRDIREELQNNAVPDVRRLLDRLDNGIITPLHSVNTIDYNNTEGALKLLKQALDRQATEGAAGQPVTLSRFDEASDQLGITIEHMQAVLAQMMKLESFNEVVQMLREIIKQQEELETKVKDERKKKLIEGLK